MWSYCLPGKGNWNPAKQITKEGRWVGFSQQKSETHFHTTQTLRSHLMISYQNKRHFNKVWKEPLCNSIGLIMLQKQKMVKRHSPVHAGHKLHIVRHGRHVERRHRRHVVGPAVRLPAYARDARHLVSRELQGSCHQGGRVTSTAKRTHREL